MITQTSTHINVGSLVLLIVGIILFVFVFMQIKKFFYLTFSPEAKLWREFGQNISFDGRKIKCVARYLCNVGAGSNSLISWLVGANQTGFYFSPLPPFLQRMQFLPWGDREYFVPWDANVITISEITVFKERYIKFTFYNNELFYLAISADMAVALLADVGRKDLIPASVIKNPDFHKASFEDVGGKRVQKRAIMMLVKWIGFIAILISLIVSCAISHANK